MYLYQPYTLPLQAAWAMSHRFTYHPGHGLIYLILSGVISLILPIPLTAVHLSGGADDPDVTGSEDPDLIAAAGESDLSPHFYLDERLRQCVRDWGKGGQTGFLFYVSFSLILDVMVVLCPIGCSIVVQVLSSTNEPSITLTIIEQASY